MKKILASRKFWGNSLIALGVIILGFIYLPILKLYLPQDYRVVEQSSISISIPKINAYAPLVDDVDPWKKEEYLESLKKGVAIAKGFSKPGEDGTVYIFAHSSDSPWNISNYNTVFFRLGELKKGDLVKIKYNGNLYSYKVSHSIEVWPNEVDALTKTSGNQLILQTCTPIGTSLKRLLVFADPA